MGRKERRRRRDGPERKARKRGRRGPEKADRGEVETGALRPTPATWALAGAGLASVLVGFILLAQGSISVAPVLLVIGFLVFFPLALVR